MYFEEIDLPAELKLNNGEIINLSDCVISKSKRNIYQIHNGTYSISIFKDKTDKIENTYYGVISYKNIEKRISLTEETINKICRAKEEESYT